MYSNIILTINFKNHFTTKAKSLNYLPYFCRRKYKERMVIKKYNAIN